MSKVNVQDGIALGKHGHPYIHTHSGKRFYAVDMTADMVDITDIALGIAKECRFAGQIRRDAFYSVAQHSVLVARHIPLPPEQKIYALLHDAAEAYIGDVPKPFKVTFPDFNGCEDNIMAVICEHFGLQWPFPPEIEKVVKEYDSRILVDEATQLFDGVPEWTKDFAEAGINAIGIEVDPWSWQYALEEFSANFDYYYRQFKGADYRVSSGC